MSPQPETQSETISEIPNADWGPLAGLPGNPIMWMLIASELLAFGAIFVAFSIMRTQEPGLFAQSQNHLNRLAGAINTMVLLTSGFVAALAVQYQKQSNTKLTRLCLVGSSLLGLIFLGVKGAEYAEKSAQGITTDTNTFYMFYYLTTGFHAMHVVFGIVILLNVAWKNTEDNVVTGTAFWHMVDLIWIILFPLIYLVR